MDYDNYYSQRIGCTYAHNAVSESTAGQPIAQHKTGTNAALAGVFLFVVIFIAYCIRRRPLGFKANYNTNLIAITVATAALATLLVGCSGYRSAVKTALVSSYQPTIYLLTAAATNTPSSSGSLAILPTPRSDQALNATATSAAPLIFCAEQINLMIFGGSAASNSVLTDIKLPLPGAL